MNGVHDMAGMHGFGPIDRDPGQPVFHEPWEARMLGLRRAATRPEGFSIDHFRAARERIPPVLYLRWSYYEHWYYVTVEALLEAGMISQEELVAGHAAPGREPRSDAQRADQVWETFKAGGRFDRKPPAPARFAVGQKVRAISFNPRYHTRLPRYARGKTGRIHRGHGAHVFPDAQARNLGECPEHLYSVMFTAREVWGEDAPATDKVVLDLWESYLEPC